MSRFPAARPTAGKKRVRPLKTVPTHVLINSGQTNHAGETICDTCGHLRSHRIHDLNESMTVEAAQIDARRIGEAETVEP